MNLCYIFSEDIVAADNFDIISVSNTDLPFSTYDAVEFDGITILQGDNGAAGGATTPKIFAAATIKYTGTLRSFFPKKILNRFYYYRSRWYVCFSKC